MRGVSPTEIEAAIDELNAVYDADQTPYRIEQTPGGYRLILRPAFERMRDKFYGRAKEARLSAPALEVLSVLAYNQPATAEYLGELRERRAARRCLRSCDAGLSAWTARTHRVNCRDSPPQIVFCNCSVSRA